MSTRSTLQWYLNQDGELDLANILKVVQEAMESPSPESDHANKSPSLEGRQICLVVGHEPGGGAAGERSWNLLLAEKMAGLCSRQGAEVYVHHHRTRAYSRRMSEMRAGILKHMPQAECVVELHFNSVDYEEAHGHEFHYREFPDLAKAIRDAWQKRFPWSKARRDDGIFQNRHSRGALMLQKAPAPACLVEPFFASNPEERAKLFNEQDKVAAAFVEGISEFLTT